MDCLIPGYLRSAEKSRGYSSFCCDADWTADGGPICITAKCALGATAVAASPVDTLPVVARIVAVVIVVVEVGNRPVRPPDNLLVPAGVDTLAGMADMEAVDTVAVAAGSTRLPQTNQRQWHLL